MTNLKQGIAIFAIAISAKAIAQPVEGTLNWYNQEGQGMFYGKGLQVFEEKGIKDCNCRSD